jgi:hypothetical protein
MQTEESSLQTKPENGEAGAKPTRWNEPIPNIAREKEFGWQQRQTGENTYVNDSKRSTTTPTRLLLSSW